MQLIKKKPQKNRINEQIVAPKVRVIGDNGEQLGIMGAVEALEKASEAQLDLVEISPNADPPVVQIMNYGKFIFQQNKKKAAAKKKQKQTKLKEIKFRPNTDIGDYEVKLRNLRGFIESGDKVKVTVWFKGREILHKDLGFKLIERIKHDLEEITKIEQMAKMEGKQLIMTLAPIGKQKVN